MSVVTITGGLALLLGLVDLLRGESIDEDKIVTYLILS